MQDAIDKIVDYMDKVDQAIKEVPAKDPDAIDQIAKKLDIQLEHMMEPATPLSASPEEAVAEAETKVKTKSIMLRKAIDKEIGDILNG